MVTILGALLAAGYGTSVASGPVLPGVVPVDPAGLDSMETVAAEVLSKEYGLSSAEAVRQMARQDQLITASAQLQAALGEQWSGSRIDWANGGRLVASSTDPDRAASAVRELGAVSEFVDVESAEFSLQQLELAATEVKTNLVAQGFSVQEIQVRPRTNDVNVVYLASSADVHTPILDSAGVPVTFEATTVQSQDFGCLSTVGICDAPLRGGIELSRSDHPYACTTGMIVRSKTNGTPYALTAGHCASGYLTEARITALTSGTLRDIGATHNWINDSTGDVGLLGIRDPAGWGVPVTTRVLVQTSGGSHPTTLNQNYVISSVGSNVNGIPADTFLCYTGATTDTQCVTFDSYNGNFAYAKVPTVAYDFGSCVGDSGGPLYASGKGYGILKGSVGTTITRSYIRYFSSGSTVCVPAGGTIKYTSLFAGLNAMNVELVP